MCLRDGGSWVMGGADVTAYSLLFLSFSWAGLLVSEARTMCL